MTERKDATEATKAMNDRLLQDLPFEDRQDFEDAERGFIAPLPDGGVLRGEDGYVVWDPSRFSFIEDGLEAPDTVNPSLWRQSQLVLKGGLLGRSITRWDAQARTRMRPLRSRATLSTG